MKIAVIGAGSTYTPELINGFIERIASLPLTELALMDINPQRLEIVGGFARRMVAAKGAPFAVTLTTDQRAAVKDARYVITQLRVGGLQARREDEYLGRRHGLVGQETTGIGGMGKAPRTIPVILQVARDMAELAPEGVLVNFTNPSGLVTEALSRHAPQVSAVGVCNGPFGQKMGALNFLKQRGRFDGNPDEADADILGLNHLSWFRGLTYHDVDLWDEYLELLLGQEALPPEMRRLVETTRMIPRSTSARRPTLANRCEMWYVVEIRSSGKNQYGRWCFTRASADSYSAIQYRYSAAKVRLPREWNNSRCATFQPSKYT